MWREKDGRELWKSTATAELLLTVCLKEWKESGEAYESEMDVKGERGRNKAVRGHTHPPALPPLLLLHTK